MKKAILVGILLLIGIAAVRLLPKALRQQAMALNLLSLLYQMIAMTATNTAKVDATQKQVADTAAALKNTNISLTAANTSLTALGPLVSAGSGQCSFLAGLQKLNHLAGQPTDTNTGGTWATGERSFINNCVQWINNIDGDLQNKGWMS